MPDLLEAGPYFWRVMALGSGGTSGYTLAWSFHYAPLQVALKYPYDQAELVRTKGLQVAWHPHPEATSYLLQLGTDPDLEEGNIVGIEGLTDSTFVVPDTLAVLHNTSYYWQVTPVDQQGIAGLATKQRFTTRDSLRTPYSLLLRDGQTNIVPYSQRHLNTQQQQAGLMPAVLAFRQDAYSADTRLTITVSTDPEGTDLVPVTFEPITDWSALMSNPTLRQQVVDSLGQTGDPKLVLAGVGLNNVPYGQTLYVRAVAEDSTEVSARSVARGFGTVFSSVGRSYYGKDHLGSVRVTVTGSGEVVQASDYDPFGLQLDGRSMAKPDAPVERYTGHELDEETDLYYAGARYLDPMVGRWLAVDPLADEFPGLTPYNYVANNPLSLVDPDGQAPTCPECVKFVVGAAKGAYNSTEGAIRDFITDVQTSEGRDNILRSMAPLAPAPAGDDRTPGDVYSDIYQSARSGVNEVSATLSSGDTEAIGAAIGTAVVTIIVAAVTKGKGRKANKLSPKDGAEGPHTSFRRDENGQVSNYETYELNPHTGEYVPVKRFRKSGRSHGGVDPPIVYERPSGKGPGSKPVVPRKPNSEELPEGSN